MKSLATRTKRGPHRVCTPVDKDRAPSNPAVSRNQKADARESRTCSGSVRRLVRTAAPSILARAGTTEPPRAARRKPPAQICTPAAAPSNPVRGAEKSNPRRACTPGPCGQRRPATPSASAFDASVKGFPPWRHFPVSRRRRGNAPVTIDRPVESNGRASDSELTEAQWKLAMLRLRSLFWLAAQLLEPSAGRTRQTPIRL